MVVNKLKYIIGCLKSKRIEKKYNAIGLENYSNTIKRYAHKKLLSADSLGRELQEKLYQVPLLCLLDLEQQSLCVVLCMNLL